jgi:hypothetical protein
MTVSEHERWMSLPIRRPDDVPSATPLSWQVEKHDEHNSRLMTNAAFLVRGDVGDALAVIALRESMRYDIEAGRGVRVREAIELGATWCEVAAALNVTPDNARTLLREWAEGQYNLHRNDVERGEKHPLGIDADRYAAVLALTELGDDESARHD